MDQPIYVIEKQIWWKWNDSLDDGNMYIDVNKKYLHVSISKLMLDINKSIQPVSDRTEFITSPTSIPEAISAHARCLEFSSGDYSVECEVCSNL